MKLLTLVNTEIQISGAILLWPNNTKLLQIKLNLFYHGFCPSMACFVCMDGNFKVVYISASGWIFFEFVRCQHTSYSHYVVKKLHIFKACRGIAHNILNVVYSNLGIY